MKERIFHLTAVSLRVQSKKNDTTPRVTTMDRLIAMKEPYNIRTKIMKKFKRILYRGTLAKCYENEKLYLINYEDRDSETSNYQQMRRYRCIDH